MCWFVHLASKMYHEFSIQGSLNIYLINKDGVLKMDNMNKGYGKINRN